MELTNATFTSTFMGVAWEGKHTLPLFTLTSNVQNLTEIVVYKFATGCLFMRIDMSFNLFDFFSNSNWIGDNYIRHSGFLPLADANDVIMLFPQV